MADVSSVVIVLREGRPVIAQSSCQQRYPLMNSPARLRMWCAGLAALALLLGYVTPSLGQAEQPDGKGYRKLAPGVMQSIDPAKKVRETFARHDIVELLAIDPNFDWAKGIPFRHDVWHLEFKFKPVRMISVDVPQRSGKMRQELIWYIVYSISNHGQAMHPTKEANGTYKVESVDLPVRFVPEFLLETDKEGNPDDEPKAVGIKEKCDQCMNLFRLKDGDEITIQQQYHEEVVQQVQPVDGSHD